MFCSSEEVSLISRARLSSLIRLRLSLYASLYFPSARYVVEAFTSVKLAGMRRYQ